MCASRILMTARCRLAWLVLVLAGLGAPAVSAQTTPPVKTPATAPAAPLPPDRGPATDLTADIGEGYERNMWGAVERRPAAGDRSSGFYTQFTPALHFDSRGDRVRVTLTGETTIRYYTGFAQLFASNHFAGLGVAATLTPRTTLVLAQSLRYSPADLNALFARVEAVPAGGFVPPDADYALAGPRSLGQTTSAHVTRGVSARGQLSVAADFQRNDIMEDLPGYSDLRAYDVATNYTQGLDRHLNLTFQYAYRTTEFAVTQQVVEHTASAGVVYALPISATRKTSLTFHVGPSAITGQAADRLASVNGYRMIGDASLDHPIGRTWHIRGGYERGLSYLDGLSSPVSRNALGVGVSGFATRRLSVATSGNYSTGAMIGALPDVAGAHQGLRSYSAATRLQFAFWRAYAAYVDGVLYRYLSDPTTELPAGLDMNRTRSAIRFGVMLRFQMAD